MAYGFGIVGCGMIANFHARAIEDLRGEAFDLIPPDPRHARVARWTALLRIRICKVRCVL